MSRLIQLIDVSLYFPNKLCFESFNHQIHAGDRIALIGDNGCGKSSLLQIIKKIIPPSDGIVHHADGITVSYVSQILESNNNSGAEQFNRSLTKALALYPDVLILDEPTNHLDNRNRHNLMRLLEQFMGTLIIASHDVHLLKQDDYCFWHFNQQRITVFQGQFDHFQQQKSLQINAINNEMEQLHKQKKQNHISLMKEQKRAKNSRIKGEKSIEQSKWPTIVSKSKVLRALETSGKKKKSLFENKEQLINRLEELGAEEEIKPHFELPLSATTTKALITIIDGAVGYDKKIIRSQINLNLNGQSRLALCGDNGSGKSTILKAIMRDPNVYKEGIWITPALKEIGYLDQHYQQLENDKTVLETIQQCRPDWSHAQIRHHLNDFLFRKNEQVYSCITMLSGGEKARLSLAKIAANPPKLLILDELTNNLDLRTKNHVINLMKNYPGPFVVISHDNDFLEQIELNERYIL